MKTPCSTKMICVLGFFLLIGSVGNAQFFKKLKKRAEESVNRTVERKVEEKAEQKTEQAIDSLFQIGKGKKRKKNRKSGQGDEADGNEMSMEDGMDDSEMMGGPAEETSFAAYSKFDFTPGETILGFEDFSKDEIGDLPARWNTNTSAEVVSLSTLEGKWMRIGQGKSAFVADFISEIPENFTLEFDVVFDYEPTAWAYSRSLGFILSDLEDPNYSLDKPQAGKNFFRMNLKGDVGARYFKVAQNTQLNSDAKAGLDQFSKNSTYRGLPVHVSIWRQKTRVRVYVDEKKVFDVPRALEKGVLAKTLRLQSHVSEENEYFYVSNIRYAVGKPDMRNKLLTEGKLVTYGITFDSGSAILRPESHGTLKKVAAILNENPELQVEIVGHTDADGDADFNMDLSMMRASAVAQALEEQFGVAAEQLSSNGKGETELLDEGNSLESKAKNRRVEFIKQ
ncbi:OmpA family protein [Flagellimonas sp. S174]|uniref:OmpA family protein n=1 Tax=Flagellimonas sp. S174 TaxID=3410790 RepID=UPI003BF4FC33